MRQILITFLMLFIFCSCDSVSENENNTDKSTDSTNINMSNSGDNELSGKAFSNETVKYTFEDSTVKQSSTQTSRAINWTDIADFKYTFDSKSTPKTMDFQLEQVWGTGIAANYEKQLETAKNAYKTIASTFIETLNDDTLYSTLGNSAESIKNIITAKAQNYIDAQEEILSDYLDTKYKSLIKFTYELTDTTLTLTEVFQNNLKDASSKFTYSDDNYKITLNDYDHVIPFKVEIGDKTFVGVPSFNDSEGKVSVQIYPYCGNVLKDEINKIATDIYTKIATECSVAITNDSMQIMLELAGNNGSSSPTLEACIDKAVGKQTLEATYKLDATTSPAKLELTFTNVPTLFDSVISQNSTVTLEYTPLLQATVNLE